MKKNMGLKRWDKVLAAILCASMTLAEPAATVAEEVVVEENDIEAEEYSGEDSVSENITPEDKVSENKASDSEIPDDTASGNEVSSNTVSEDETEYTYLSGVQPDDLVIDSLEAQLGEAGSAMARSASLYEDITGAELPEKYDARNVEGRNYVTSARDQLNSELCWAFSMASVVESNMIKKGFASADSLRISPDHLGYFFFHHVDDELGGTKGASVQVGRKDYYSLGGNSTCGTLELANWVGAVEESKARFSTGPQVHDDSIAYDDISHMQNAYWVKASDRSYIKELIREYGSATINCVMSSQGIQKCEDGTASYLYVGSSSVGHAVTIIGWDDNYPASNFKSFGSGDTEKNGKPAKENGAWLIKDSYGDKENRVDGCFYMSYEDSALKYDSTKAIAYDMESADNYDHNYQYDGAYGLHSMAFENSIYGANVYQARGNQRENGAEKIDAVSFATDCTDASYSIQIYTNLENPDTDPTSGIKAFISPQTGNFAYAGYHTIKLNAPVVVNEGEYFSVVISLNKNNGNVSLMTDESYNNGTGGTGGWAIYTAALERGRSFYGTDGYTWTDAYDRVANGVARSSVMRIKAFTNDYEIKGPFYVDADMVADIPEQTYTGEQIIPDVKVYYDGRELKEGEDFQATYGRNVNVGKKSGSVVIRGIGNYITENAITKHFDIVKKDISDEDIIVQGLEDCLYNGEAQQPVTVYHKDKLLGIGSVKITYKQNKNVGTASVTVKGSGNYTGTRTETFNIKLHDISASGSISINQIKDEQYVEKPIEVRPVVKNTETGATLKLNHDYTLLYRNNVMPGIAKVTVIGTGGYTGRLEAEFRIKGKDISKLPMTAIKTQTYNGGLAIRPAVVIKDGSDTLKENVHFTATYEDNINVGTATIRIEGKAGTVYSGSTKVVPFIISPLNIATGTKLSRFGDKTFVNGLSAYTQDPILSLPDGRTLTKDQDYTIKYTNNTSKGMATMTITAIGPNYTGVIVKNFQISDKICLSDYSDENLTITGFTYDRRYIYDKRSLDKDYHNTFEAKPQLTITYRRNKLEEGKDYTITYRNYDKIGTAEAVITAVAGGRFYGSRTEEYYIVGRPIFPLGLDVGFALSDPVDKVYTGGEVKQNIVLTERVRTATSDKIKTFKRKEGVAYTVDYRDNVNAGTATYTITGINDYSGSDEFEFKIEPRNLDTCTASKIKTQKYTGEPVCPNVYLKVGKRYLVEGQDYDVEYQDNIRQGTASIVFTACKGSQNFVGSKTVRFKIKKTPLSSLKYGENIIISSLNGESIKNLTTDYDGTQKMPVPRIIFGSADISDQCSVTYGENRKIGYGTITLTALPESSVSGKKTIRFKIKGKPLNVDTLYDGEELVYTGKAIRPSVDQIMTLDGEMLTKGIDYKIKYKKSVNAGNGYLYLQGLGDYKGSGKILRYTIQRQMVEDCVITGLDREISKGTKKEVRPAFTVKVNGRKLQKGKDFTVTYLNNRAVGTGTVKLKFVGNYDGIYSQQFTIGR